MFGILTSGEQTCITCWILILYIFKVKKTIQLIVVNKQSEWENTFGSPKFPCVTHMQNCVNATGNLHDSYVSICDSDSTWKNLWYTYIRDQILVNSHFYHANYFYFSWLQAASGTYLCCVKISAWYLEAFQRYYHLTVQYINKSTL